MSQANGQQLPPGWAVTAIEDLFWPLEDGRTLHQGWSPQCEKTPAPTDQDWGVLKTTAIQAGAFLPQHNKQLPSISAPVPKSKSRRATSSSLALVHVFVVALRAWSGAHARA